MSSPVSTIGMAAGNGILAAAPFTGPAAPIVAAVGGLVDLAATVAGVIGLGNGCGPTCVQATQIVNQAEPILKQNVTAFQSGLEDTATAESNFNQVWNAVVQSCGAIPGDAGKNCIGDRQRGGKWDWFSYYYDPIANAPTVTTNVPNPTGFDTSSVGSVMDSSVYGIPLWAVVGFGALLMLSGRRQRYAS